MKYFIALTLIVAVASALTIKPQDLNLSPAQMAEVEEILAAINSPSTDPTTAAALEHMLLEILGLAPAPQPPIGGPAIIDEHIYEDVHVLPEIVDFPINDAIDASPVAPAVPAPAPCSPLVQIIVNVQQAEASPVSPVQVVENPAPIQPEPVIVVDEAEIQPTPVIVVDEAHVEAEPVIVAPIIVEPAVIAPETLN